MPSTRKEQSKVKRIGADMKMICGIRCGWEGPKAGCTFLGFSSYDLRCPVCGALCEPKQGEDENCRCGGFIKPFTKYSHSLKMIILDFYKCMKCGQKYYRKN